jgi:hypothetical protein
MKECLTDETIFTNLLSFDSFTPTTEGSLITLATLLSCSADTLTSLTLLGRHLSYQEVLVIASIFSHRPANSGLQNLSLKVLYLTLCLLMLLAKGLPGLKHLYLSCFDWKAEADASSSEEASEKLVRRISFQLLVRPTYDPYIISANIYRSISMKL